MTPIGIRQFEGLRQQAIDHVADRFQAAQGAVYEALGERGREACREDLAFHLEFLRPVLEFGYVQPMLDYLHWLEGVLTARGVPARHLSLSLEWLSDFFAARLEARDADVVIAALAQIKALYRAGTAGEPAFYKVAPEAWPECEAFQDALLSGDRSGASGIFDRCLAQGRSLIDTEMHLIQPAQYEIGRKWQSNQVSVAQEHLATAICQSLMARGLQRSVVPPSNGSRVVLACVEGNSHTLGLQMLADAFQLAGWDVHYLGANVPSTSLLGHLEAFRPHLVGLSVSFAQQLRVVKDFMSCLRARMADDRPPVLVGGLAINQFRRLAGQVGADAWPADAVSAVAYAAKFSTRAVAA